MKYKSNKGFTLIELLVVIAIIGILASIILVSLNGARQKGQDARVEGDLSSMRSSAELYYSSAVPNSYATTPESNVSYNKSTPLQPGGSTGNSVCSDFATQINSANQLVDAAENGGGSSSNAICSASASSWAALVQLNQTGTNPSNNETNQTEYYCVDSNGTAAIRFSDTIAGDGSDTPYSCPTN